MEFLRISCSRVEDSRTLTFGASVFETVWLSGAATFGASSSLAEFVLA